MFRRLYEWSVMNRGRFGELGFTFALAWLWVMTVLLVLNLASFGGADIDVRKIFERLSVPGYLSGYVSLDPAGLSGVGGFLLYFLGACVIAPFFEEACRAGICQVCTDKRGEMRWFFVIFATSFFLFGILHGGYANIFIQGALGLLLARLWFRQGKSLLWQYLSMVAVHAAYNFSVLTVNLMILRALN